MKPKKKLTCPVCGYKRLIDASASTLAELRPESGPEESVWDPDFYQKCPWCKREIGIKKLKN